MTELSTTEAKQVEQAAKELLPKGRVYAFNIGWQAGFDDGIDYVLSYILPSRMIGFAEWVSREDIFQTLDGKWIKDYGAYETFAENTTELLEKYIHHLQTNKDKEDVR